MLGAGDTVILSTPHICVMVILAVVTVACVAALRLARHSTHIAALRWGIAGTIAGLAVGGLVFKHVYELATGTWELTESLPLHICEMGVYVTAAALMLAVDRRNALDAGRQPSLTRAGQALYEIAYYWGLGGTLQAIVTPDVTEAYPSPVYFRYFITHGGIIVGAIVMTLGLGLRPRRGSWKWIWLLTLGVAVAVFAMNILLGANYMYLCGPPTNASLIDYLGPYPWYLLPLALVATASILLWYTPWWIIDRWGRGRAGDGAAREHRHERTP